MSADPHRIHVSKDDSSIIIKASVLQADLLRDLPGSRFDSKEKAWRIPFSYINWIPFFTKFGHRLDVDKDVKEWVLSQYQKETDLHSIRHMSDDSPLDSEPRLRPQQALAVRYVDRAWNAILGDDMGSGKTPTVCAIINRMDPNPNSTDGKFRGLIVTPISTFSNWVGHIEEWTDYNPILCSGNVTQRRKQISEWLQDGGVLIMNYRTVTAHTRLKAYGGVALKKCPEHGGWGVREVKPEKCQMHLKELDMLAEVGGLDVLIADEAQALFNPKSDQSRGMKWLGSQYAHRRLALTGTPSSGKPESIWSLLNFVEPLSWPSKSNFMDRYCEMGMNYATGQEYPIAIKNEEEFYRVRDLTMIRRTFEEVTGREIEKVYQTLYARMSPKHRSQYKKIMSEPAVEMASGTLIIPSDLVAATRLLQCSSSMLDAEQLDEVDENGAPMQRVFMVKPSPKVDLLWETWDSNLERQPTVVMAGGPGSRQLLDIALERFRSAGVRCSYIVGGMTAEEQAHQIEQYMKGVTEIFFGQTSAAGAGINLDRGNVLVFLQRPHSLVEVEQTENRVRRQSQEADAVLILTLATEDSYDARVHEIYMNNRKVYDQVLADPSKLRELF